MNIDFSTLAQKHFPVESHPCGTVLFDAGDKGNCMYMLKSGEVAIKVGNDTVETIMPGGIFGEMALVDNSPRSASAHCLSECELVKVGSVRFRLLVQENPNFALDVMRTMANRLRTMDQQRS